MVRIVVRELMPSRNRRCWSWSLDSCPTRRLRSNRTSLSHQPGGRKADETRDGVGDLVLGLDGQGNVPSDFKVYVWIVCR